MDCQKLLEICQNLSISDNVIEILKGEELFDEKSIASLTGEDIKRIFKKIGQRRQVEALQKECKNWLVAMDVAPTGEVSSAAEMQVALRADPTVIYDGRTTYSLSKIPSSDDELVQKCVDNWSAQIDFHSLLRDFKQMGPFLLLANYGTCPVVDLQVKVKKLGFAVKKLADDTYIFMTSSITAYNEILQSYNEAYQYVGDGDIQFALNALSQTKDLCMKIAEHAETLSKSYDEVTKDVECTLMDITSEKEKKTTVHEELKADVDFHETKLKDLEDEEKHRTIDAKTKLDIVKAKNLKGDQELQKMMTKKTAANEQYSEQKQEIQDRITTTSLGIDGRSTTLALVLVPVAVGTISGVLAWLLCDYHLAFLVGVGSAVISFTWKLFNLKRQQQETKDRVCTLKADLELLTKGHNQKMESLKKAIQQLELELKALKTEEQELLAGTERELEAKKIQEQLLHLARAKNAKLMAKADKDALDAAAFAIKRIAAILKGLMNALTFWQKLVNLMTSKCEKENENINTLLDKPKEVVLEVFNNNTFKQQAMGNIFTWLALRKVCEVYRRDLIDARNAIDKALVENPTTEEARSKVGPLAEELRNLHPHGSKPEELLTLDYNANVD